MNYREIAPQPALARFVRCFWRLSSDGESAADAVERIVPDGCTEIVFNLADPFRGVGDDGATGPLQPATLLVGQMRRHIRIAPTGAVDLLGIRFNAAGLHALLPLPLSELTDARIGFDEVARPLSRALADAARKGRGPLEDALLSRVRARSSPVAPLVAEMHRNGGALRVEAAARRLRLSERTLERRFLREVGLSPKLLARIVRFQRAIGEVARAARGDWAGVAFACGYADQSHMIRDFREFAGLPPRAYFATDHPMADHFNGVSDSSNPPTPPSATLPG